MRRLDDLHSLEENKSSRLNKPIARRVFPEGKDQKGRSDLKLASLRRDRELVELAREAAYEIVDPDITLTKQPELRAELSMFLRPEDEEFLFKS